MHFSQIYEIKDKVWPKDETKVHPAQCLSQEFGKWECKLKKWECNLKSLQKNRNIVCVAHNTSAQRQVFPPP